MDFLSGMQAEITQDPDTTKQTLHLFWDHIWVPDHFAWFFPFDLKEESGEVGLGYIRPQIMPDFEVSLVDSPGFIWTKCTLGLLNGTFS